MTATAERSAGENVGSPPDIGAVPVAVRRLVAVLHQLSDLSESLTDEQFTRVPGGAVSSTIGGHVRHNLDHVDALLVGLRTGRSDYDRRDRSTPDRERAFVLSHIVHHNALIAVIVRLVGAEPPADFGYAPFTVTHQRSRPCAR